MVTNNSKSTLTLATIERILAYIREKSLRPGESLPSEAELIAQFGVSRVILREAFSYLKGLGLIQSRRGSSFKVAKVDFSTVMERTLNHISVFGSENLNELLDLRRRLEIGSIGEAVRNATAEDVEAIRAAMKKLERFAQKENRPVSEYELLELEFHQALMQSSENRTLALINAAIRNYFMASGAFGNGEREYLIQKFKDREILEHRMLLHAFELGWPDIAESCLKRHLQQDRQ